jgi:hypothetical protein
LDDHLEKPLEGSFSTKSPFQTFRKNMESLGASTNSLSYPVSVKLDPSLSFSMLVALPCRLEKGKKRNNFGVKGWGG